MAALDQGESSRLLNASLTGTAPAFTGPLKLALFTVIGTVSATGTEVTGGAGPYARQSMAVTVSSAGSAVTNTGIVQFLGMPAITSPPISAIEIFDSAGTPLRKWWGALSATKTTNAGDTVSFAIGAVSCNDS